MHYLDFLQEVHRRLNPPTYLEIGVRNGDSLALAQGAAIGVDPRPRLRVELSDRTRIYRQTSDAFFARDRPLRHFDRRAVAMSFIDGLHHAEFALRDFINVERLSRWTSVAIFDDIFPLEAAWAARERETREWTGDVFKVMGVLERHRPDLALLKVDTEPTGLLLVLGLDRESTALADRYAEIAAQIAQPDPQLVPAAVLKRRGAVDPQAVLESPVWRVLRKARGEPVEREQGVRNLRRLLRRDFGVLSGLPLRARLGRPV
ncbi:MAG: class I SAM-dependent methyltransferase [Solirubrobacteraceae bacterium]